MVDMVEQVPANKFIINFYNVKKCELFYISPKTYGILGNIYVQHIHLSTSRDKTCVTLNVPTISRPKICLMQSVDIFKIMMSVGESG